MPVWQSAPCRSRGGVWLIFIHPDAEVLPGSRARAFQNLRAGEARDAIVPKDIPERPGAEIRGSFHRGLTVSRKGESEAEVVAGEAGLRLEAACSIPGTASWEEFMAVGLPVAVRIKSGSALRTGEGAGAALPPLIITLFGGQVAGDPFRQQGDVDGVGLVGRRRRHPGEAIGGGGAGHDELVEGIASMVDRLTIEETDGGEGCWKRAVQ